MTLEELKEHTLWLWEILDNKLQAIVISASWSNPFIQLNRDYDIYCLFDLNFISSNEIEEILNTQAIREYITQLKNNYSIIINFQPVQDQEEICYYSYLWRWAQLLHGELPVFDVDIFTHKIEYIDWINENLSDIDFSLFNNEKYSKVFYHILSIYYFWINEDYIMTEEQQLIVNKMHNRELLSNIDEIMQPIFDYISQY